jgi:hypothetical protein
VVEMDAYAKLDRYQNLLGCSNVNLTNTTDLYARYTSTVLCNAIVQNSVQSCNLAGNAARPVCAETCVSSNDVVGIVDLG